MYLFYKINGNVVRLLATFPTGERLDEIRFERNNKIIGSVWFCGCVSLTLKRPKKRARMRLYLLYIDYRKNARARAHSRRHEDGKTPVNNKSQTFVCEFKECAHKKMVYAHIILC